MSADVAQPVKLVLDLLALREYLLATPVRPKFTAGAIDFDEWNAQAAQLGRAVAVVDAAIASIMGDR